MLNMHHKTSQIYELHINNNGTKIRFLTLYVFSLRYGFVIIYQKVFPLAVFSLNKSNFLSCTEYHMCVLTFKTIESHIWAEMKTFSCNIEYVIFPKLLLVLFLYTWVYFHTKGSELISVYDKFKYIYDTFYNTTNINRKNDWILWG